jgi:type IV pilus assembly protein PilB
MDDIETEKIGASYIDISDLNVHDSLLSLIPADFARTHRCIPIRKRGRVLDVVVFDPSDARLLSDLRFITGYEIEPHTTLQKSLDEAIVRHYGEADSLATIMEDMTKGKELELVEEEREEAVASELLAQAEEAPVIRYVSGLIREAIAKSASDIHIEPYEKSLRMRIRIDGKLHELPSPPWKLRRAIASRVKVMANLDLAEHRFPQDGRILVRYQRRTVDLRVSTTPTIYGEKVVMRILDKAAVPLDMKKLGMDERALKIFEETINLPYGLLLLTGPTGSGKTTTLYSALTRINRPHINIMTVEDPVEFDFPGINQVAIRENIGLTFAYILRSFLRQDPDVIMVGEIRDKETADIAIRASLTGHLVLSTLHTNDAPSAVTRLRDMGVEPYLIASSLVLVMAQRLVRRICEKCKEEVKISKDVLEKVGLDPSSFDGTVFYKGKGCPHCNNTGYKGREGVFEVMSVSSNIREMIVDGKPLDMIRNASKKEGMLTLREAAVEKLKAGETTLDEVVQLTREQT